MEEELYSAWGGALLAFLAELPKQTPNFPRHLLQLLSRHFGFHKSFMFPFAYRAIDIERRSRREALNNIVSLNVSAASVRDYVDVISKVDIFAPRLLPEALRGRKVLFTADVMPEAKYRESEYCRHMKRHRMERQACVYLRRRNEVIATVCLFRAQEEPDFTEADRALLAYLSGVISEHYMTALHLSGDVITQEGFQMFFRKSEVGSIMLNSRLSAVMANHAAQEYSAGLVELLRKERDLLLRSNGRTGTKYSDIQQIIDWIGLELVNSSGGVSRYDFLLEEYSFLYNPIFFMNIFGDVEIRHLVLFWRVKRELTGEFKSVCGTLTQRELEILRLVAEGCKNAEIAARLSISKYTVRSHVSSLYQKFNVCTRLELISKINKGLQRLPDAPLAGGIEEEKGM